MKNNLLLVMTAIAIALAYIDATATHTCSAAETSAPAEPVVTSEIMSFVPEVIRGEPCTFPWSSSTTTNALVARLCLRQDANQPNVLPHNTDFIIGVGTNGITWTPPGKDSLPDGVYVASIEPVAKGTGEVINRFSFYLGSPTPKTASAR